MALKSFGLRNIVHANYNLDLSKEDTDYII